MTTIRAFIIAHPFLAVALSNVWGAIVIDMVAFVGSKEPGAWVHQFKIDLALYRYLQGFLGGVVGTAITAGTGAALGLLVWSLL